MVRNSNMPATISPRLLAAQANVLNPHLDKATGLKSHLFQPPRTPATTYSSDRDARARSANSGNSSHKRPRPSSSHEDNQFATPQSALSRDWSCASTGSQIIRSAAPSSPPLVNTRYTLAGGLDTPSLNAAALHEQLDRSSMGVNCSRRWNNTDDDLWSARTDYFAPPPQLARESNGRARNPTSQDIQPPGWGKFMLTVVGGVAGKMWDFCTAGAFRGFYAGGGRGYDVSTRTAPSPSATNSWEDINILEQSRQMGRDSTPVPGQYPVDDYKDTTGAQDSTRPRPPKRLHTDTGNGWIMVSHSTQPEDVSPRLSPRRSPGSNFALSRSMTRRHSGISTTNRRSLIPTPRRSSSVSYSGSPAVQPPQRNSLPTSRPSSSHGSPLSPEAQRYAERIAREDREADRSMRRLNSQLKAMIKQGKQALGTKFEIEDEQVDEGFSEDF